MFPPQPLRLGDLGVESQAELALVGDHQLALLVLLNLEDGHDAVAEVGLEEHALARDGLAVEVDHRRDEAHVAREQAPAAALLGELDEHQQLVAPRDVHVAAPVGLGGQHAQPLAALVLARHERVARVLLERAHRAEHADAPRAPQRLARFCLAL